MISIIVPAYNEEKRITKTLLAIEAVMINGTEDFEILAVNDGSHDNTAAVVRGLENEHIHLLSYEKNRGKGGAVKYGVEHAVGDYIAFIDADLPYPPESIPKAHAMLAEGCDAVLGKRVQTENGQKYPWYRTVMSKSFGLFVRTVLHMKEKDTQCGFKAFRAAAAKEIFSRVTLSGWGFDVEIIFIAERRGYRIKRLPVELFHENDESKINVVQDTLKMAGEVFAVRRNHKKGLYR